jgi:hypothetical protein
MVEGIVATGEKKLSLGIVFFAGCLVGINLAMISMT